jgi:phosphate starvation-inducible PhoH-like protein
VVTGDVTQVDLPHGVQSGLSDALSLLGSVEGLARCFFTAADVVRHPLVQRIVNAYDGRDAERRGDKAHHGHGEGG